MQAYARAPVLTVNGGNGGFDGYRCPPSTQSCLTNLPLTPCSSNIFLKNILMQGHMGNFTPTTEKM